MTTHKTPDADATSLQLSQLHDATLAGLRFDWASRSCLLDFSGTPSHRASFSIAFDEMTELTIAATHPWGASSSILEAGSRGNGRYEFALQSGDTITIVAARFSFRT